jgi:nitrogen regulatory protein PII
VAKAGVRDHRRENAMKLVTAIARPERLDELIDTVLANGGRGLTVTDVRGFGRQFGQRAPRVDTAAAAGLPRYRKGVLLTKVRLDIVVPDEDVQAMVDAIAKQARTGVIGDGKIWVSPVDDVVRVRTGERDLDAVLSRLDECRGNGTSVPAKGSARE